MEKNPIHTLENVVIALLGQKEWCDLEKIRQYLDKFFGDGSILHVEDFQKAYMYTFAFVPDKNLSSQRLIYRCIESRLSTEKIKYLSLLRIKKQTPGNTDIVKLDKAITSLELLPGMIY